MRLFLLVLLAAITTSCTPKTPLYHTQSYVFGTLVDVSIYGEKEAKAKAAANDIFQLFQTLHQQLHAWQPSELTRINDAFSAGQTPVNISREMANIIQHATTLSTQSKGRFNPAIGKLIKTWGFHRDAFTPKKIDEQEIKKLVGMNPSMADIKLNDGKIVSTNPHVQLDLGGYAKGYALDKALQHLKQHDIQHALINIGGNIIALGQHGNKPWRVGIQHPRQPNAIASIDLPSGWAIGTSGDYQRFFILDGQRYCHVINPATGYPATGIQSVTMLIPAQDDAGTLSDVASKPIFIAEKNQRASAAKAMGIDHYLIIESHETIQISPAMAKRIRWLDQKAKAQAVSLQ